MALTIDGSSASGSVLSAASLTFAKTIAGSQRSLVVPVALTWTTTSKNFTGVTCDGVAMTELLNVNFNSAQARVAIFGLVAPNTGTHDVVVSASASTNAIYGGAISFNGADQSAGAAAFGTPNNATGTSFSPSVNISSQSGEYVIDILCGNDVSGTPGAGQTEIFDIFQDIGMGGASFEVGGATVTMSWTLDSNIAVPWVIAGISVKAAAGASGQAPRSMVVNSRRRR